MNLASLSYIHEVQGEAHSPTALDRLASVIRESFYGSSELSLRVQGLFDRLSEFGLGFALCTLQLASVVDAPWKVRYGRRGPAFDDFFRRSEVAAHELLTANRSVFSSYKGDPHSDEIQYFCGFPVTRGQKNWGYIFFEFHELEHEPSKSFLETLSLVALLLAEEAEIDYFRLKRPRLDVERSFEPKILIGSSGAMQNVFRDIEAFSRDVRPVLLCGEPGVGKKLAAHAIHESSPFSSLAFVTKRAKEWISWIETNEAPPPELRKGGTLYLDEAEELPSSTLSKLVLWARNAPRSPLRLVFAATKLTESIQRWKNEHVPLTLELPPLRERAGDLIGLCEHFVTLFAQKFGKKIHGISTPAYEMLFAYPWPGNVRELEEVLERAVFLSHEDLLHAYHLPPNIQTQLNPIAQSSGSLQERLDALEYELLTTALRSNQGNVTKTAQELGLTKRIMGLRLQKFNLDYRTFRTH